MHNAYNLLTVSFIIPIFAFHRHTYEHSIILDLASRRAEHLVAVCAILVYFREVRYNCTSVRRGGLPSPLCA